jgi:hypothetical protein
MRLGTMKSRAPSGVDFVSIGVSTSMKPAGLQRAAEALRHPIAQERPESISGRRMST